MDANKLQKLRDIDYIVRKCCGNCQYGYFNNVQLFGVCQLHTYKHKKHSETDRYLSISRYGHCNHHRWAKKFLNGLGKWDEFIP